jgi:hypothetical protein
MTPSRSMNAARRQAFGTVATELLRDNPRQAILFCCRPVGAAFRDYFLDYCLPSLLSPGNFPRCPRWHLAPSMTDSPVGWFTTMIGNMLFLGLFGDNVDDAIAI